MAARTSEYQNDTNRRMSSLEIKVDKMQEDISDIKQKDIPDIKIALARYTALYTIVALLLAGLLLYVISKR